MTKKISSDEISRLNGEKQNRNVSGLNPNDFKFFEYKDPYAKNRVVKCSICGKAALEDEFGNGECKNCGWRFGKDEEKFEQQLASSMPAKNKTNLAKTPQFPRFFANTHLKYGEYVGVRLYQKSSGISAFWLLVSLTADF